MSADYLKSVRSVSEELGVSFRQVQTIRAKAQADGTQFPETKAGRPRRAGI
jgi:transposase